jgi:SAM-dependent methyltransferase
MKIHNCRICNKNLNQQFIFREMMFGFRDEFTYAECSNCGAIQIIEVPADIEKYYPPYYMAFTQKVPVIKRLPLSKRLINNLRIKRKYRKSNHHVIELLRPLKTKLTARILDIGCGRGSLICALYNMGFEDVSGVDKFIPAEINHGNGVKVYKKELSDLDAGAYDVLSMSHVLEHMEEQVAELKACHRLLKKGGVLIISIPILGEAWEIYREKWVQLDAPRHFVLHTLKSMTILAEKTGFAIEKTVFDSGAFQFWGSELYKKDIPLTLPDTHEWYPAKNDFTAEQLLAYESEAKILNDRQRGDTARFYFYKR